MKEEKYFYKTITSPVGKLRLIASDKVLVMILWESKKNGRIKVGTLIKKNNHPILLKTETQLEEYFLRKRKKFSIPFKGIGTEFQKMVWDALVMIPFGETRTYAEIAQQIGRPKSARPVGGAIGNNPISIIVPCHRVIGATGKLVGFAGGLESKTKLLYLEKKIL